MKQTKGAIGNLLNRYRAVLKKCHLLNTFGSLAVAGMLVMGGAGVAQAEETWIQADGTEGTWTAGTVINTPGTVLSGTYDGFVSYETNTAGVAAIDYNTPNVRVESGTTFSNNSMAATDGAGGGALKILTGATIGDNVTFDKNTAIDGGGWGGGAIYIKLTNGETPSEYDTVTIGKNAQFIDNSAKNVGGAIALEYGNLNIEEGAVFRGNSIKADKAERGDIGGGAIAVWHDYTTNGDAGHSKLTVTGATFESNSANISGGAIYNSDGDIEVTNSIFTGNTSSSMGGAIYNNSGPQKVDDPYHGTVTIKNSRFEGNIAGNGGAVWQGTDGTTIIEDSEFIENSATIEDHPLKQGGAVTNAGIMKIARTTFQGNEAGGIGGAIANVNPQGGIDGSPILQLSDVTVTNNWAGTSGGGI